MTVDKKPQYVRQRQFLTKMIKKFFDSFWQKWSKNIVGRQCFTPRFQHLEERRFPSEIFRGASSSPTAAPLHPCFGPWWAYSHRCSESRLLFCYVLRSSYVLTLLYRFSALLSSSVVIQRLVMVPFDCLSACMSVGPSVNSNGNNNFTRSSPSSIVTMVYLVPFSK